MEQLKQPIQNKINRAILLTSTVVLLVTGLVYLIYQFFTFRESMIERMSVLGEVVASNSTAALAFDSRNDAFEILSALEAQEHIVAAVLYDDSDFLFTSFPSTIDDTLLPDSLKDDGFYYKGNYLNGYVPVMQGNNRLGTLFLKYDMGVLLNEFRFFGIVAVSVFVLSLLLAYLLSYQLQKRISKPIIALADVAESISLRKDYSIRAVKQSEDEIGLFTDAFNQMLEQIEQQSKELKENEKKFRALADNISQLAWMTDETGWIFWYNKRWFDYTGTTLDEMEGWGWKKVHHPDHVERVEKKFRIAIDNGEAWEDTFPLRGKDGNYRWFLSRAVPIKDDQGNILNWFGTNTDISELLETEEALRKSEEFNRTLLESSPDCVKALDIKGRLLSVNPVGLEMLEIDDFEKFQHNHWRSLWEEEYHTDVDKALESARNGEIGHFQAHSPTTKGNYKWWDVLVAPVHDADGNVERFVSVSRDITKIKELEQQKDDFLSIASHELKTPVTSLKVYTELLIKQYEDHEDKKLTEILAKMDSQIDKLTALITDLLDVTRIEQGKLQFRNKEFSLNKLVKRIITDIKQTSDHSLIIESLSKTDQVYGDKDRVGQVITNFLNNAIKYSSQDKKILVSTKEDNGELIFSVQDFGIGLSEEDQEKVFNRFFRSEEPTNKTYPGLGLGLFISCNIIERHGGKIWVESEKGEGSTFFFSLALQNESGEKVQEEV